MLRRNILMAGAVATAIVLGGALAGCSGSGTTNVGTIISEIQKDCKYQPNVQSVIQVLLTVTTGIDPSVGAAATVTNAVANQVVTAICQAVNTQVAATPPAASHKLGVGQNLVVVVNGVQVNGTYLGK